MNHPFLPATKDLEAGERHVYLFGEIHILPVWNNVLKSECTSTVCRPLDFSTISFVPVCMWRTTRVEVNDSHRLENAL